MGLRCSLLGHDFGDVVVEREREERGAEVVVTERELRECRRCSAESVVSENTEVRRLRPEETDDPAATTDEGAAEDPDPGTTDVPEDDAVIMENEPPPGRLVPDDAEESRGIGADAGGAVETNVDAGGTADRRDSDSSGTADRRDSDSSGTADGEPAADDAAATREAFVGDDPAARWPADPREGRDRGAGETGSADRESAFEFGDPAAGNGSTAPAEEGPRSGIASKGPIESTGGSDDVEGTLVCPACGFSVPMARSSLRAGDICPDCHAGYLAEER